MSISPHDRRPQNAYPLDMQQKISRRKFLHLARSTVMGAALLGSGSWTYASSVEPRWYDVVPVEVTLPRLAPAFDGFRIAQISDLHVSSVTGSQQLNEVVEHILSQRPDLVAITGDYIDRETEVANPFSILTAALRPLAQKLPVITVLGNNDYRVGAEKVREVIRACGMLELPNAILPLERGGRRLYIAGLDDVLARRAQLPRVVYNLPQDGEAAILLVHEPDYADHVAFTRRFDLQISGHSHGGQVVAPLLGPLELTNLAYKYVAGLYRVGDMLQYTNRGLGAVPPRVRFNCRPEITLLTLRSQS